jgi:ribosome-binding protein aMBF1 (putative translation factor)
MSAHMKKPRTEVEVRTGTKVLRFKGVPQAKLRSLVVSLEDYRDESAPWREVAQERFQSSGCEGAYMVRAARKRVGMTQVQLAEKLKMPQGNLSQIETGKRSVGKLLAKRLSKVLGVDYRVFL